MYAKLLAMPLAILAGSALITADAQLSSSGPAPAKGLTGQVTAPPGSGGGGLLSGGSDDCVVPDVIVGTGSFFFDNASATTGSEGQNESLCYEFSTTAIDKDVWFGWVADFTGDARIDTCGSSLDTKIAGYSGATCPADGTALDCNDDSCGLQSRIIFPVVNGQVYTLQVGLYPGSSGGTGILNCNPVPVTDCTVMHDGTSEDSIGLTDGGDFCYMYYVDCLSTIETIKVAYGTPVYPGSIANGSPTRLAIWDDPTDDLDPSDAILITTISVPAGVTLADTDTLNFYDAGDVSVDGGTWIGAVVTHQVGEHPGTLDQTNSSDGRNWAVGATLTSGVPFNYNDLMANDVGPLDIATAGYDGAWLLEVTGEPINERPGIQYCPGDGVAPHTMCPCGNVNDGSMGGCLWSPYFPTGGVLDARGTKELHDNDVYLDATNVDNNFGIFFGANNQLNGGNGNPLGCGLRCAGGGMVRLTNPTPVVNNSTSCGPVEQLDSAAYPGSTRRYQYWFRSPLCPCGAMQDLTNGYEITWYP